MASRTIRVNQKSFGLGVQRDMAREFIGIKRPTWPPFALWTAKDWIPSVLRSSLSKRGPWSYSQTDPLMTTRGGSTPSTEKVVEIVYAPYYNYSTHAGADEIILVGSGGTVWRIATTADIDVTTVSVGGAMQSNPVFFNNTVVFPSVDGAAGCFQRTQAPAVATYATGTYKPTHFCVWRNRLVGAVENRLIFGPPDAPPPAALNSVLAWDDTAAYKLPFRCNGLVTMGNSILVLYGNGVARVTGTIPTGYGVTTDDDILIDNDYFPGVGCVDAHSIAYWQGSALWADKNGVYISDGAGIINLTQQAQMQTAWYELMKGYSGWRVAGTVLKGQYIVSLTDPSNAYAEQATWVFDLATRTAWQFTNFPFPCYTDGNHGGRYAWAGVGSVQGRIAQLSGVWFPDDDADGLDGNSVAVEPVLETPYYRISDGFAQIVETYLGYRIDKINSGDTPYLKVEYTTDPFENPTYHNAVEGGHLNASDLNGTSDEGYHYKRAAIRQNAPGFALRLTVTGATKRAEMYAISSDVMPADGYDQG